MESGDRRRHRRPPALWNAAPAGFGTPGGWPADNAILYSVLCSVGIIAVFAPLAIAQYRRISKR